MAISIRSAKEEDASELLCIYAPYVLHTAITFEYEVPSEQDFAERIRTISVRYPYLVAEIDGKIVGYAYGAPFHNDRRAYQWAAEVSIYIDQAFHGQGIGRQLYMALEQRLKKQGVLNINAAIAYPEKSDHTLSTKSADFHAHMGFQKVGMFHRCGFKFQQWYHILWMEKFLGEHTSQPMPLLNPEVE